MAPSNNLTPTEESFREKVDYTYFLNPMGTTSIIGYQTLGCSKYETVSPSNIYSIYYFKL